MRDNYLNILTYISICVYLYQFRIIPAHGLMGVTGLYVPTH